MSKTQHIIDLANELKCTVMLNEPLSKHTTFHCGGPCKCLISVNSQESISQLVKLCKRLQVRYMIIGNGSNLLFDDKGYDGIILQAFTNMQKISLLDDDTIIAQAGCSLTRLCTFAYENSLSGLEFAYGIPGTVGGGVYMNAGAYGGEIKDVIYECKAISVDGEIKIYLNSEMDLSYRHSAFHTSGEIVTEAVFKLEKGNKENILAEMQELMGRRKDKQPLEYGSAGSTFKRPEGQFAGKLIEDCGLKGYRVGGAMVSKKHCGFVINYDNATSQDVKQCISDVQKNVLEKTGFNLECEVKIIPYSE